MDLDLLRTRAHIIREVRSFFDSRQYLSADTPLLAPDLIPENCLEVFETSWLPPCGSKQQPEKRWLIPSPEIWMKRMIADYGISIYQICKCFRNTESRGHLHCPEFTMLEYYTMNAGYLDSLAITEELFTHLIHTVPGKANSFLKVPFSRITMEDAFIAWAGFSLTETVNSGRSALEKEARRLGLESAADTLTDQSAIALLFDLIFIHTIEPSLPKDRPVAILDYPEFIPCLAKNKKIHGKNSGNKERWELYINGIELANCYSEETDPQKMRFFFKEETQKKEKNALIKHRVNHDYWKYFLPKTNTPSCGPADYSGVALGLDRLVMAFTGKSAIDSILPFPF